MQVRSLDAIAGRRPETRVSYAQLRPWRVRNILLVSSLYDSFTFEEDGSLTELLFSEYLDLNLSSAPTITRVTTAKEAIESVQDCVPDLLITMPRVGDMDVFEFGRCVKSSCPQLPVVLLTHDTRELSLLKARDESGVDRIFVWQGDARIFLAIIKLIEDARNAQHDAEIAGVKSILLIEDSVRFYSAYLPLLYTEIMEQTQALMADGVNRMQKLLRMRARPKIMIATSFEEGEALFHRYREQILGLILDARFPRAGRTDGGAGLAFARMARGLNPYLSILMQSSDDDICVLTAEQNLAFANKQSPTLLREVRGFMRAELGFGSFQFRTPSGTILGRARSLRSLEEGLRTIPEEALLHHASRNDFSTWLMARTEFDLAKALQPRTPEEFATPADLRRYLVHTLAAYREESQAGLVAEFSRETFDPRNLFTRIGSGSLGGKGRGLAFFNSLLTTHAIERHFPNIRITVPPTAVVATDTFDAFMERSSLAALALSDASDETLRAAFLGAPLPDAAVEALREFVTRVTYPLAVRSSSLLEDSSFQPFAGIYDTFMLPNNHPDPEVRLEELCRAIRLVYASTYYADSKSYIDSTPNRLEEEKMAVVIQQLAGRTYGQYTYPDLAGVARSYDYYPMEGMDPEDGVASVALGLGRTVVEGGRCVRFSPAHPRRLYQFSSTESYLENAQREFYALDMQAPAPAGRAVGGGGNRDEGGSGATVGFARRGGDDNITLLGLDAAETHGTLAPVASVYSPENDTVYDGAHRKGIKLVTMAGMLSGDFFPLANVLKFLLDVGRAGFSCHVEIEFALNLSREKDAPHEFAFLQIRPLVFGTATEALDLSGIAAEDTICMSSSALGHGYFDDIQDVLYVRPDRFERGKTARIATEVGQHNARLRAEQRPYLLIGPGRWGSADHWLGIPVSWSQICGVGCIVESELKDIRVTPSQGTHFFQNLTSFGIGYFTLSREQKVSHIDFAWLDRQPASQEGAFVRHLRFEHPLNILVDGATGTGVVMKPGRLPAGR